MHVGHFCQQADHWTECLKRYNKLMSVEKRVVIGLVVSKEKFVKEKG